MTETMEPLVVEREELKRGAIGQNVPRKEDKRLVQGEGVFVDDVKAHGMAYVEFVRSPYAHARIRSIDVSKALELDGVYGTLTGDEVAIQTEPFFQIAGQVKDYALAVGKVRHVGESVAAVAARTRELARDAAELVEVEYEPLEAVTDTVAAAEPGAPQLHDDHPNNVIWQGDFDYGDYESAVAEADKVVRIEPELGRDDVDHALGEPQVLHARVAAVGPARRLVGADLREVDAHVAPAVAAGRHLRPDDAAERLVSRVRATVVDHPRVEAEHRAVALEDRKSVV